MTIHTTMKIEVAEQDVVDALDAAGYGIGYWASKGVIDEQASEYRVTVLDELVDQLNGGENPARVSFTRIVHAMVELYDEDILRAELREFLLLADAGELDSDAMDTVVQQAIFGKVVFG